MNNDPRKGHYGGVQAALRNNRPGLIDNGLRHVQHVMHRHETLPSRIQDEQEHSNRQRIKVLPEAFKVQLFSQPR